MTQTTRFRYSWLFTFAVAALVCCIPARASLIVSISNVSAPAGAIGASFDVNLQSAATTQSVAGFNLALSVGDTHFTFTGGNTGTTLTYLFAGDSFDVINAFAFTTVPPPNGQALQAGDLSNGGAGTTLVSNQTVGLGHIVFNLAGNTPAGPIAITIVPNCVTANACTSFSDADGDPLAFTVAGPGTITVTPSTNSAPEPSTIFMSLTALAAVAWRKGRRQ